MLCPPQGITLDPARFLALVHLPGPLTVAVVSLAWLRGQGAPVHAALVERHLSADEAARAAALSRPGRRLDWLGGRLAVKHSVSAHLLEHTGVRWRCPCRKSHPSWWELVYGGLEHGPRMGALGVWGSPGQ